MPEAAREAEPKKPKRQESVQEWELKKGLVLLALSIPFGPAGIPARAAGSALVGDAARRVTVEYIERRAAEASAKVKKRWYDKMYAFLGKDTKLSRLAKHGIALALGALVAVGAFMLTDLLATTFTAYAFGGDICRPPFGAHEVVCPAGTPAGLHCAVHPMDPTNYFYYECPPPHALPPPHPVPPHHVPPPPPHAPPPPPPNVPIS